MSQKLESRLVFMIETVYEKLKISLNRIPTQAEVYEGLVNLDMSVKRSPQNIINKSISQFYQSQQMVKQKELDDKSNMIIPFEKDPQKKIKTNQTQQNQPQQQGIVPLSKEQIDQLSMIEDLGALSNLKSQIDSTIYLPIQHSQLFQKLGVQAPRGILLTGPTGCGKTVLANAICRDLNEKYSVNVFIRNAAEIVGSLSGESEKNVRSIFQAAVQNAPSILFIDEIDVVAGSRDRATKEMERRVVTQLVGSIDSLPTNVYVIAATSFPDLLDPGLRRCGRFDKEIMIAVPNDTQREEILRIIMKKMTISQDIDIISLSRRTPGYVAADLQALCREAGTIAVRRISNIISAPQQRMDEEVQITNSTSESICIEDFEISLKIVQPSAKREGFAIIPDVSWNDIGSLQSLKLTLEECIVLPIQNPEIFEKFAVKAPAGVLLWGPPGCGKTLLAKAVANASRANFIAVKGPELLNKYVGESEKAIRSLFARARASQPCVIFFDEIDAICPIRGGDGGGQVTERVVNQLLTELDGFDDRKQVFIIAATNRPDILDPAILRPGRIDKPLYVPIPDQNGKIEILKALSNKCPLDKSVDFNTLAQIREVQHMSGADLSHWLTQAALLAIIGKFESITQENFINALKSVKPSIKDSDIKAYEKLKDKWDK